MEIAHWITDNYFFIATALAAVGMLGILLTYTLPRPKGEKFGLHMTRKEKLAFDMFVAGGLGWLVLSLAADVLNTTLLFAVKVTQLGQLVGLQITSPYWAIGAVSWLWFVGLCLLGHGYNKRRFRFATAGVALLIAGSALIYLA